MPLTEDALRIAQSKIKWVDFKWARDNVTLPELEAHGVPRRNHKFKGSFPSLPSVPLMKISDDTIGSHGAEVPKRNNQSDIRGQIGLEHNIAINDGKWLKYNWDHPDGKDDNDLFASETYLNKFVLTWHQNVLGNVRAKLLIRNEPEHWKCDIDTDTGFLAPPIAYPDTIVDLSTQIPELRWRRHNFTSALIVRNYEIDHERRTRRGGRRADIAPIEYESIDPEDAVRLGLVVKQPEVEIPVKNPITPRAKCYLRPAQKADMEAVARIYNWEVKNGLQALDSEPLAIEDFKKIFKTTQELGMPFLVAVSGSVGDLHLNDRTATYSPYRQILPNNRARPKKNSKVLGFSYLSVWEPGLAGGGTGASRATAKIHVFVDHASRMKKIGFSLLDKLISSVSGRYSSESSYDFVDPSANPIYKHPIRNHDRKYYQVYLNYFVKHKHRDQGLEQEQKSYDDDLKWVKSLLEEKLNFSEKVRFEATHRTAKARSGPVYWLDSVVFEHTCQFDPRFEEGF
ncbi:hypothetical protein B0T26DRAFT_645210 [Lasiosphaeria miniovina]|uniref:N-acetyltransferase domain-containing protein n=1 Tax=Lasiosphaeria miniovina TaxID=1954250 RepID=A0AA40AM94_9PEZI|nr:uncharacterized protein B0T26DRAFT_645210 [Lasiosphaeria miniovina]KAK0718395.1 hypothetical protein B0T26DRAFT_645210 [Lasiosphaeria miniovina]